MRGLVLGDVATLALVEERLERPGEWWIFVTERAGLAPLVEIERRWYADAGAELELLHIGPWLSVAFGRRSRLPEAALAAFLGVEIGGRDIIVLARRSVALASLGALATALGEVAPSPGLPRPLEGDTGAHDGD